MREETKRLLDRLGQPNFQYREYKDDASEEAMQRWPLFELIERRLVSPVAPSPVEARAEAAASTDNDLKSLINRISSGRPS